MPPCSNPFWPQVPCSLKGHLSIKQHLLKTEFAKSSLNPQVQAALAEDVRKLKATFLEVLLSRAPSARS